MGTPQENRARIEAAFPVIDRIAGDVIGSRALNEHEPKLWELLATKLVLGPYYRFCMSAGPFAANDRCVGCGKCAALCPFGNITLKDMRPVWGKNCTHCMTCINLCPKDAIEYGSITSGKLRYHGPEV
jgi:ferredoxin